MLFLLSICVYLTNTAISQSTELWSSVVSWLHWLNCSRSHYSSRPTELCYSVVNWVWPLFTRIHRSDKLKLSVNSISSQVLNVAFSCDSVLLATKRFMRICDNHCNCFSMYTSEKPSCHLFCNSAKHNLIVLVVLVNKCVDYNSKLNFCLFYFHEF